jgi:hypothetical protein
MEPNAIIPVKVLGRLEKLNYLIGNGTHDLLACRKIDYRRPNIFLLLRIYYLTQ